MKATEGNIIQIKYQKRKGWSDKECSEETREKRKTKQNIFTNREMGVQSKIHKTKDNCREIVQEKGGQQKEI